MMDLWMIQNIAPLFYRVMELSIAAVCIGLGVLLLRKVVDKRIPPIWKNALWLLVLVALVVPFRPVRTTAVLPPVEVNFRQQENILHTEITQDKTELDGKYQVPVELTQQREDLHAKSLIFEVVIPAIWLLGMAVMMCILLITRQKMLRNLRTTTGRPYDGLLMDCKQQLGITKTVEIVEQSYLKTPALYGLLSPKILLPDYVAEMSEDSQKYILLHELSHLKHWDLWKNALLLALQVVYWFNPLVWILFRFIRQDMELLNDQRVLKTLEKSEETPYAMSLIQVLGHAKKLPLAPQMLCMVDNKGSIKRRIQMIQLGEVFKKHKIIIAVGCLAVIGVLSALFLTAQPEAPDPGSTDKSKPITLRWAHTLDKDDIEKVELYWTETGEDDTTYLLDENQRATLCIMLNNFYGEETENVPPSQGVSAQYSIYRTDGTVETISFVPLNEVTCFFRLGWDGFMGDQYQMNDWLGLINSIRYDQAPPSSNEPKPLLDLANDPNVTIVDYVSMDDMAYGQVGIVCYIKADIVWISYLTQDYEYSVGIGTDGEVSPLPDSKLRYLGDAVCEIDLLRHETEEEVTFTMEYWPNEGDVLGANTRVTASDYVPDPWGITLTATDVTPTGMTLSLAWDGAEDVTGTLMTGAWFAIDVLEDGTWTEVYAPRADWTEEGYPLPTTQEIDWEWLYGALPSGIYRIEKEVLNIREPGDFDRQIYTAQFEVPEQELVGDPRLLTADELAYFNDHYFDILYDQEDYYVRFSEGTRMGDTVTLTFRGYEPDTGDVYEMIAEILTLEQVGDGYVFVSRDYAA